MSGWSASVAVAKDDDSDTVGDSKIALARSWKTWTVDDDLEVAGGLWGSRDSAAASAGPDSVPASGPTLMSWDESLAATASATGPSWVSVSELDSSFST